MDYRTLHMKTVVELRQLAKELKIKVPAGTAKNRLVELVLEGQLAAARQANERAAQTSAPADPAAAPAVEAAGEDVDGQNESGSFDVAPEEDFTDFDRFTDELGSLLFDLLNRF